MPGWGAFRDYYGLSDSAHYRARIADTRPHFVNLPVSLRLLRAIIEGEYFQHAHTSQLNQAQ
jgi:hypothetical protein